jgi:hypothetical protein
MLLALAAAVFPQRPPAPPIQIVPSSFPAHDQHENFTVALTLCADETCARQVFGKHNPVHAGILPVNVYFRNDSDQPLVVGLGDIRLDIRPATDSDDDQGRPQELAPLSTSDTAQRILYPTGSAQPQAPGTPQVGFGWPHSQTSVAELAAKLDPLALHAGVISAHSTAHGYLFFDLGGNFALISQSSLDVPSVHSQDGSHYLTYFEVSLARSLSH